MLAFTLETEAIANSALFSEMISGVTSAAAKIRSYSCNSRYSCSVNGDLAMDLDGTSISSSNPCKNCSSGGKSMGKPEGKSIGKSEGKSNPTFIGRSNGSDWRASTCNASTCGAIAQSSKEPKALSIVVDEMTSGIILAELSQIASLFISEFMSELISWESSPQSPANAFSKFDSRFSPSKASELAIAELVHISSPRRLASKTIGDTSPNPSSRGLTRSGTLIS